MEPQNRIKEVLEQKGFKQAWLADKLGKTPQYINDLCSNRSQPSFTRLHLIAELLDVNPGDLLVKTKQ